MEQYFHPFLLFLTGFRWHLNPRGGGGRKEIVVACSKDGPQWTMPPAPLSWAVPHNQWKVNAAVLPRLKQKKPCSICLDLLGLSASEPNHKTRRSPCHMERPHARTQVEINGQPHEEPSWTCSAQRVFRWLQPQLLFESKSMRLLPLPARTTELSAANSRNSDLLHSKIEPEENGKPEIKPGFSTCGNMVNEIEMCGLIELFKFECSYLLFLTPFP